MRRCNKRITAFTLVVAILLQGSCGDDAGGSGGEVAKAGEALVLALNGTVYASSVPAEPASDRVAFVRSAVSGLYVGVHPVTKEQWVALMGSAPWMSVPADVVPSSDAVGVPAYNLSQIDGLAVASALAGRSGYQVIVLPGAAWRAEVGVSEYPWGTDTASSTVSAYAVTADTGAEGPQPTGRHRATAAGLRDLIGNIRQWTAEGTLVGGSWHDGIRQCGRSVEMRTVPPDERHPLCGVRLAVALLTDGNAAPVVDGEVVLPAVQAGTSFELDSEPLLAGTVDPDGDPLRVVGLGSAQARIVGSGPWTIQCSAAGVLELGYLVVDGKGGVVARTARCNVIEPGSYDRYADRRGVRRLTQRYSNRYVQVRPINATGAASITYDFGFRLDSFEGHEAGVDVDATLCRGSLRSTRSTLTFGVDKRVVIVDEVGRVRTLSTAGGPAPGEIWDCRLDIDRDRIALRRRSAGGWTEVGSTAADGFGPWMPTRLLVGGSQRSFHGALYYWAVARDGVLTQDVRIDEMAGKRLADALDAAAEGQADVSQGQLEWCDDLPMSDAPDPGFAVTGSVRHGAVLVISADRPMFPGGLPPIQLYDDGTLDGEARSGRLDTRTTLDGGRFVSWSFIKNADTEQTWKAEGPGGRSYTVDYDGVTGERVSRGLALPRGFSEAFVARSLRVPAARAWPGGTDGGEPWEPVAGYIPNDSTWKSDWLLSADDAGKTGSDLVIGSHASADRWAFVGNSVSTESPQVSLPLRPMIAFGEWFGVRGYVRHNAVDPGASLAVSMLSSSRMGTIISSNAGYVLDADRGYEPYRLWLAGAWVDRNPLCLVERADIYAAFGLHAACRVEIGDSPIYGRCTALAVCPPLAWEAQRIEARCALGSFDPESQPLYIFIIGPDGMPVLPYGKRL
jgi:hypothetical protein